MFAYSQDMYERRVMKMKAKPLVETEKEKAERKEKIKKTSELIFKEYDKTFQKLAKKE